MKHNNLTHLKTTLAGVPFAQRETCHLEVEFRGYERMQLLEDRVAETAKWARERWSREPIDVVAFILRRAAQLIGRHNTAFHMPKEAKCEPK